MYRRVLVPLDGSPEAERALAHAERAADAGGEITLVEVVMPGLTGGVDFPDTHSRQVIEREMHEAVDRPRAAAEAYLAVAARRLGRSDVAVRTRVLQGDPADRLLEAARDADLVVLATGGRSGFGLVGRTGVPERLIRDARVPVLVVH